jgi:phage-related protein
MKKDIWFIASSHGDLKELPNEVQKDIGFALYQAEIGGKSFFAKPLSGFSGAGVLEVVVDEDGDTFRAVYTVKLKHAVYVLHVFQKKSKSGIKTPQRDIDLIKSRLKLAEQDHATRYPATKGRAKP